MITENEKVIRKLYQITSQHKTGFAQQVHELLLMGSKRLGLEIGILSNIVGNHYHVVYQVSPDDIPLEDKAEFNLPETYCALTIAANKPVGFEHVGKSEIHNHPAYAAFALEAYIGIPIFVDDKTYGTLNFSSPTPRHRKFSVIDIDALKLMAIWLEGELSRQIYQKKILKQAKALAKSNKKLKKMARTDGLTQVGNRHSYYEDFNKQLRFANRINLPFSVILLDIDNFKNYNDSYGHLAGDKALVAVSQKLTGLARASDNVVRFGGEEFIILLPDTGSEKAVVAAERFRHTINRIDNLECKVTSSFGVSTYSPDANKTTNYEELMKRLTDEADKALYYAKDHGKNCVYHFDSLSKSEDTSY